MKSKVLVLAAGVAVSLFLVTRYFALSRAGVPLGWMLYLGLPVTGAGVLFALRLLELGDGWRAGPDTLRRRESPEHPAASSERLRQLDILYARGVISDREYRDRRLHIIAGG
ncbi:SHOCT domain-containing protein [Mycobacterium colombiense]|uniref:SHOCT domain-containing protein n=1 Tax=Mycobacterium colombiense CECT 3035 TaxID=1041522 RepID=J5EPU0_9MYCO|nr:SHOCT domain-containing protein [Mycobacterium colombiense]EJO90519.1 hypothetical protein MCOL_V210020 [Mycobacterium colombiense CECT 3035]